MLQRRNLTQNTILLLAGNVGSVLLSFVLFVVIGRGLGDSELGVYVTVLAWVFLLVMLSEFGTNTLMVRDLAANPEYIAGYLQTTAQIRLMLGGVLMVLLWVCAPLMSHDWDIVIGLRLAAPLLLIEPTYGAYSAVLRARGIMAPIAILNTSMLAVQVFLVIWLVFGVKMSVAAILAVNTLTSFGRMVAAWLWTKQVGVSGAQSLSKVVFPAGELLRRAIPFAIAGVLAALQMRLSILLLEGIGGVAVVGLYAAGTRFVEPARVVPLAFFDAVMPVLSEQAVNQRRFDALSRRGYRLLLGFGVLVGIGALFGAYPLIWVTYGGAFWDAVPVMMVAAWLMPIAALRQFRVIVYYGRRDEQVVNWVLAIMLGVGGVTGAVLIPIMGAVGAVLMWGMMEATGLILLAR